MTAEQLRSVIFHAPASLRCAAILALSHVLAEDCMSKAGRQKYHRPVCKGRECMRLMRCGQVDRA